VGITTKFDPSEWTNALIRVTNLLQELSRVIEQNLPIALEIMDEVSRKKRDASPATSTTKKPSTTTKRSTTATTTTIASVPVSSATPAPVVEQSMAPQPAEQRSAMPSQTVERIFADLAMVSTADFLVHKAKLLQNVGRDITILANNMDKYSKQIIHPFPDESFILRGVDMEHYTVPIHQNFKLKQLEGPTEVLTANKNTYQAPLVITQQTQQQMQFNATDEEQLIQYIMLLTTSLDEVTDQVKGSLNEIFQNKMPENLYNKKELIKTITTISAYIPSLEVTDIMVMLKSLHTTFPYKRKCALDKNYEEASAECPLSFVSLVPKIRSKYIYDIYDVVAMPTFHKGIIKNDWKRITVDPTVILSNEQEKIALTPDALSCMHAPQELFCDICHLRHTQISGFQGCLNAIMKKQDPWKNCDWKKIDKIVEESVQLNETTWVYADPNPGSLSEKCPDTPLKRKVLAPSGLLQLNKDCQYSLNNGPLIQGTEQLEVLRETSIREIDVDHTDDSLLEEHWENNNIYYLIGLSSTLGVTLVAFSAYCYSNGPRRRPTVIIPFRNRRNRREAVITEPVEALELAPVIANIDRAFSNYLQTV